MGKYEGTKKIQEFYETLKKSLDGLSEIEYLIRLLETEVENYESLIDKENLIPKVKFVKYKLERLINRLKYDGDGIIICAGIKIKILGDNISISDRILLKNDILTYLDNRIRPIDILFKIDETNIGIIFALRNERDEEAVIHRLNQLLVNIKTKTHSSKNVLINFKLKHFRITKNEHINEIMNKMENLLRE